jgi:hypothetical protein
MPALSGQGAAPSDGRVTISLPPEPEPTALRQSLARLCDRLPRRDKREQVAEPLLAPAPPSLSVDVLQERGPTLLLGSAVESQ